MKSAHAQQCVSGRANDDDLLSTDSGSASQPVRRPCTPSAARIVSRGLLAFLICGAVQTAGADSLLKGPFNPYPEGLDEFRADTGVTHTFNHPNSSPTGECVWFVRAVRPDTLPTTLPDSYAYRMWENAGAAGWHRGQTPKPGAVMVIGNVRVPPTGHVAIVQSVNGDGTIDVWDSNWSGSLDRLVRKRRLTDPTNGLLGYLYSADSDNPPILGSSLVIAPDGVTVYLLQNGRIYHVASYGVVQAMESAGMPGWVWASRRQLDATEFSQYQQGPEFILPSPGSDGLLVRERDTTTVYVLQNGRKRAFQSPAALNWMGRDWFPDVIDVAPGMLSDPTYVVGSGNPIYELSASLQAAYNANAADPSCTAPSEWKGWPVDPSFPSTFSRCLEFPIEGVGSAVSAVSGISGSYQNMGAEANLAKGAIEQTSLGTYAVHGAIFEKWRDLNYTSSALGFPIGNEYAWNGNRRSDFEGGYIYWTPPPVDTTTVVLNPTTCTSFSISPTFWYASSPSSGSTAVTVTGAPAGCTGGSWTASGNGSWLSVAPSSGSGSGSVTVSWTENTGPFRSSGVTIAGNSFPVDQAAATTTCTSFSISPTFWYASSPSSGSTVVTVTGAPAGCTGGSWTASGNGSWLSVSPTSGSGSGSVTVSWTQNTGPFRSSGVTIAGNSFPVDQAAATTTCASFSISPTSAFPTSSSGSVSVTVTGSPGGCTGGSWSASGNGSWISVTPTSGSGWGSVTVSWTENTSAQRSGSATIAGQSFTVTQQAPVGGDVELANGVPYSDSLTAGTAQQGWKYYFIVVPAGATRLDVLLDQVSGDVDLYTNPTVKPSLGTFVCRPYISGPRTESCSQTNPTPGVWWIGVNNWDTGTIAYRVTATYSTGGSPSITLDSPEAGEALPAGSTYTIRWTSANLDPSGSVQVWYTDTSGWLYVDSVSPTETQYSWTVPSADQPITTVFVGSAVGSEWEATDDAPVLITRPTDFYTVTPCRVIDTRLIGQGSPAVGAGETRRFKLDEVCAVPATARAVAVNVTVTGPTTNGNIRFFPAGLPAPLVSTLNYAPAQTRANNAVLTLGMDGSVDLTCSQAFGTVEVIVDVVGYFE
jgi:surface antigen